MCVDIPVSGVDVGEQRRDGCPKIT